MRRILVITSCLLVFGIGLYFFIFSWLVPKTAALALPYKWRNLPLRQSKQVARDYLGVSISSDSIGGNGKETWSQGAKGRAYLLQLSYTDTVVTGYSIRYVFKHSFASRNYLLDSFSVR